MATNEIVRMQEDLERSLGKPAADRAWVMVIDTRKCVGDHACAVSCMAENVCPPGTSFRKVFDAENNDYPNTDHFFMPANCQHCDNPPCAKAANRVAQGAVTKHPDGIVTFDYQVMGSHPKAAAVAQKACPYYSIVEDKGGYYTDGTPKLEPYETRVFYENGEALDRKKTKGTIRKCTFCAHRLEAGMLPACVTTCIGRAMYFGDANDPQSLVAELLKKEKSWQMHASLGTKPRVHYIGYAERGSISAASAASCIDCHD